ncbi:P-type DNA transfer ATPase VirB11 [Acidovorax sp. 210-6]|uniref:P-type DNA transfer ATPase VirB11 n=1 Tax=Acidovorax sp. 210-6 TaxID=2699468 RepID=UPI001F5B212A|nr:P-type DNA transfer ATPase VirB11 [Acidovorax sp. 210-6]
MSHSIIDKSASTPALSGEKLMRRAMLDTYLKTIQQYLKGDITEVAVNQPGEVWTEGPGGWQSHPAPELTFQSCLHIAQLIATYNEKDISIDRPILSATLPDGERVQVIIPPACLPNTVSITIRKPSITDKTLDELEAGGTFSDVLSINDGIRQFEKDLLKLKNDGHIRNFLHRAVLEKRNLLITGKTGSGKTTLTRSLIHSIPKDERLVTIEDVHELFMGDVPNKVHLLYAREDEGGSKVTAKQSLASCLRMKPDRILLAELRGDEAWEFVKSINTGHPGSISTMHANGAWETFEQLTAFIKDSRTGAHLETQDIKRRLYTTIDVVVYMDRWKVREIFYDPEFKRSQMA